jgi:hypothetical protein
MMIRQNRCLIPSEALTSNCPILKFVGVGARGGGTFPGGVDIGIGHIQGLTDRTDRCCIVAIRFLGDPRAKVCEPINAGYG